jgi:hypothetical protein
MLLLLLANQSLEKANMLVALRYFITWGTLTLINEIIALCRSPNIGIAAYVPVESWRTALNKNSTTYEGANAAMNVVTNTENPMKIVIEEHELKEVVADYLRNQMPDRANENFDVQFTAGRGPQGHYAEIDVSRYSAEEGEEPVAEEDENEAAETEEAAIDPFGFDDDETDDE